MHRVAQSIWFIKPECRYGYRNWLCDKFSKDIFENELTILCNVHWIWWDGWLISDNEESHDWWSKWYATGWELKLSMELYNTMYMRKTKVAPSLCK